MTKEQALKNMVKHWRWLWKNPCKNKSEWPGIKDFSLIQNNCFCCEHVKESMENNGWDLECNKCSVKWTNDTSNHCSHLISPYRQWTQGLNVAKKRVDKNMKSYYAKQIMMLAVGALRELRKNKKE